MHIAELTQSGQLPTWFAIYQFTDYIRSYNSDGTGNYNASNIGPCPTTGDIMESRAFLRYDGKSQISLSTNGGAESVSSLGSPFAVPYQSTWGGTSPTLK
jgi:hypothetical protein